MAVYPCSCDLHDLTALLPCYRFEWMSASGAGSCFDFDKGTYICVACNDVDLFAADAEVAGDYFVAGSLKEECGVLFRGGAELVRVHVVDFVHAFWARPFLAGPFGARHASGGVLCPASALPPPPPPPYTRSESTPALRCIIVGLFSPPICLSGGRGEPCSPRPRGPEKIGEV